MILKEYWDLDYNHSTKICIRNKLRFIIWILISLWPESILLKIKNDP